MKKLITVVLILAMLLPIMSVAEEPEEIVGCYYLLYDKNLSPEFASTFGNSDIMLSTYIFDADGTVSICGVLITDHSGTPEYGAAGKWTKEKTRTKSGFRYVVSILGLGSGTARIEDDCLLFNISESPSVYVRLRKMVPFDPYNDYIYR